VSGAVPDAATEKLAVWPAVTVWFAGSEVIDGATDAGVTVSTAVRLVMLPAGSLTTA
jgi:hypothetical protein